MAFCHFCVIKCKLEPAILCASLDRFGRSGITCAVFCACTFSTNCTKTKTTFSFTHFALFDLDAHRYLIKRVPILVNAGMVNAISLNLSLFRSIIAISFPLKINLY